MIITIKLVPSNIKPFAVKVLWIHLPFEAAVVKSHLHGHCAACIEMTAFNGDPCSSRQWPSGWVDTGKVRRLRRDTGRGQADQSWLLDFTSVKYSIKSI